MPVRITLRTKKALSKSYALLTEAAVDYVPSPFGLVPGTVTHRQYLNTFLMVENDLHYTNYRRPGREIDSMSAVAVGSPAPDFELPDQNGALVRLSGFRGKSAVVVYFYPKDDTKGCTAEACAFRDDTPRFEASGAAVLGISDDSTDSHRRFAAKYRLGFTLLSDKGGRVRKLYGVKKTLGIIPGRVTFVIDREGVVRHVFSSQVDFTGHVREALLALGSK